MRGGGVQIVQNCVTSFMHDPKVEVLVFEISGKFLSVHCLPTFTTTKSIK